MKKKTVMNLNKKKNLVSATKKSVADYLPAMEITTTDYRADKSVTTNLHI
jgi:hypothetical protein